MQSWSDMSRWQQRRARCRHECPSTAQRTYVNNRLYWVDTATQPAWIVPMMKQWHMRDCKMDLHRRMWKIADGSASLHPHGSVILTSVDCFRNLSFLVQSGLTTYPAPRHTPFYCRTDNDISSGIVFNVSVCHSLCLSVCVCVDQQTKNWMMMMIMMMMMMMMRLFIKHSNNNIVTRIII